MKTVIAIIIALMLVGCSDQHDGKILFDNKGNVYRLVHHNFALYFVQELPLSVPSSTFTFKEK